MSRPAISIRGIGKKYKLGLKALKHRTFREAATDLFTAPLRRMRHLRENSGEGEEFWALRDITFDVQPGEVVGIIGRNGAGKSTLLKILTRITEPTEGEAVIRGRVGSLLEVGTGFHPELTGRENIYLNGAILGMRKAEIQRRFDEIVQFSGVEKFLDTPVKHYSSGMRVRLAFAVAAHLEPEILLIDEVLAVGDIAFQRKCLGKMREVAATNRTVLFVSHNLSAVSALCGRAIMLDAGALIRTGGTDDVIRHYLTYTGIGTSAEYRRPAGEGENKIIRVNHVALRETGDMESTPESGCVCEIDYSVRAEQVGAVVAVQLTTAMDVPVTTLIDTDLNGDCFIKRRGRYRVTCPLPDRLLNVDTYFVTISISDMKGTRFDYLERVLQFEVARRQNEENFFPREGPLRYAAKWQVCP